MKTTITFSFLLFVFASINAQPFETFGQGMNGEIDAMLQDDVNGVLYAGGLFSMAGGNAMNNIAEWNGTAWSPLGGGTNNVVNDLAIFNGELYAVGSFSSPGNHIAKWDGNTWTEVGGGTNSSAFALQVHNGALYVGGAFTAAGGVPASHIAKRDGNSWSGLAAGVNDVVYALSVYNNELHVGGEFSFAGALIADKIAKWDGSAWSSLATGIDAAVWALQVYNGELYAGGTFNTAGGVQFTIRVAKWNGTTWSVVGSSLNNTVFGLAVYDGDLYAGGFFDQIWATSDPASRIAKWDGTQWSAVGSGVDAGVFAMHGTANALYIGGEFSTAGGDPASNIAALGSPISVGIGTLEANSTTELFNYPNPFTSATTISFEMERSGNVDLEVSDLSGRVVLRTEYGIMPAGNNSFVFEAKDMDAGLYIYTIRLNGVPSNETMMLNR